MSKKKWGSSNKETLDIFLRDFKQCLANNIKSEVLSDVDIMSLPRHKFYYYLRSEKCKLPAIGSTTRGYWVSRGWSLEEAEEKRTKIKMGNKSPMKIKFWLNKGYNKSEAINKIKSFRKINIEYWINKGYSESESMEKVKEYQSVQGKKGIEIVKKLRKTNPERFDNKIEYWINKGYSANEAIIKLKERQATFSLEKCIKKYGKNEGTLVFNNRQKKWLNSLHENFKNKGDSRTPSSKFANECIKEICSILNIGVPVKEKWINGYNINASYDFTYNQRIIEFNGDYWHCNPKIYEANYFNKALKMTAAEKWDKDKEKRELAESKGYSILVIWRSDYLNNKKAIIDKCIKFLNNGM